MDTKQTISQIAMDAAHDIALAAFSLPGKPTGLVQRIQDAIEKALAEKENEYTALLDAMQNDINRLSRPWTVSFVADDGEHYDAPVIDVGHADHGLTVVLPKPLGNCEEKDKEIERLRKELSSLAVDNRLPYARLEAAQTCKHTFAEGVYGGPCLKCGKTPPQIQME